MIGAFILVMAAQAGSPVAGEGQNVSGRLHVGNTGIYCMRLPCPSRGVFEPDERGLAARDRILYVDLDGRTPPPPMMGEKTNRTWVIEAWDDRRCLAIEGRWMADEDGRDVLRVDRVIGICGAGEG